MSYTYLDDAVHVGDEAVDADLQQHDQGSAHVLSNLRVLVCSQRKKALIEEENKYDEKYINLERDVCEE